MIDRRFNVKVRNKLTRREEVLFVTGKCTPEDAQKHVAGLPGSYGGAHPGFEVLGVEEVGPDGKPLPAAETPEAPAADK